MENYKSKKKNLKLFESIYKNGKDNEKICRYWNST